MALRLVLLLAFLAVLAIGRLIVADPSPAAAGRVVVIDGDTLQIDGRPLQLYGIDAPELGQLCRQEGRMWRCGRDAAASLQKLVVLSGPLDCARWVGKAEDARADGIPVRVCEASREDLGKTLLHNGYAVALPGSFRNMPRPSAVRARRISASGGVNSRRRLAPRRHLCRERRLTFRCRLRPAHSQRLRICIFSESSSTASSMRPPRITCM